MASRKSRQPDYELLERGPGFHGYRVGPLPGEVAGAGSAVRYLVQLATEWGHLSGSRTRDSDIDWEQTTMEVSDHAQLEFQAIDRQAFAPTLKLLRKRLAKTSYAELSNDCIGNIVSLVFFEAFDDAFEGGARSRKRR